MSTLQKAISLGARGVLVRCGTCLNRTRFPPAQALKLFGGETRIADIPALSLQMRRARQTRRRRLAPTRPQQQRTAADRAERVGQVAVNLKCPSSPARGRWHVRQHMTEG